VATLYAEGGGLNEERREILIATLRRWVERIREPDRPILGFPDGKVLSARELVDEVEEGTERGRQYLHTVEMLLTEVPFETYLACVERSGRPRSRVLQFVLEHVSMLRAAVRTRPDTVERR
jgi:hypothetical protein